MNNNNNNQENSSSSKQDEHEHDMVMPGFRFHPTEEELVEFYLRRKVEGKRFNVELITFLDLYRYDPWELPALAAIGEKEWYFYVPRDRKYRNGDRPNRVTTSGYWKATGADRMIRSENLRSIGLKKTLVFYSGKAPKGIRTSWIMNEYRLPQHETERLQKAEISLCACTKEPESKTTHLSPLLPTKASSSSSSKGSKNETTTTMDAVFQANNYGGQIMHQTDRKLISETSPSSSNDNNIGTSLALSRQNSNYSINNPLVPTISTDHQDDHHLQKSKQPRTNSCNNNNLSSNCPSIFPNSSSHAIDDLHNLVNNYSQQSALVNHDIINHQYNVPNLLSQFSGLPPQQGEVAPPINVAAPGTLQAAFSDRLWDWNAVNSEANKDYNNLFK
ncbi:hypothetical protein DH2020_047137 [Rehmannia glutinosa]|uniref:NAC domain-containing protein n=1 Tax=Rehmannia glutinosa TaxID=99300 RepID=A0ABR0U9U2_REHGL